MKRILLAAIGTVTLVAASPVAAQGNVTLRYAHWEQLVRYRVNDLLYYPEAANGATGDVLVGFRIGADGMPKDVALRQSSGVQVFDQAAVQLVSRLGRIGPVPSPDGDVHDIVFKLSYGDGASAVASMQLAKGDWKERIANEQRDRAIVSGGQSSAVGGHPQH